MKSIEERRRGSGERRKRCGKEEPNGRKWCLVCVFVCECFESAAVGDVSGCGSDLFSADSISSFCELIVFELISSARMRRLLLLTGAYEEGWSKVISVCLCAAFLCSC